MKEIKHIFSHFLEQEKVRQQKACYKEEIFVRKKIKIDIKRVIEYLKVTKGVRRPTEKFVLSSDRTKRRKVSPISTNVSEKYLVYTAQIQFNTKVKRDT